MFKFRGVKFVVGVIQRKLSQDWVWG